MDDCVPVLGFDGGSVDQQDPFGHFLGSQAADGHAADGHPGGEIISLAAVAN